MKNIASGQARGIGNGNSFTENKKILYVVDRGIRNMARLTGWNSSVNISIVKSWCYTFRSCNAYREMVYTEVA